MDLLREGKHLIKYFFRFSQNANDGRILCSLGAAVSRIWNLEFGIWNLNCEMFSRVVNHALIEENSE